MPPLRAMSAESAENFRMRGSLAWPGQWTKSTGLDFAALVRAHSVLLLLLLLFSLSLAAASKRKRRSRRTKLRRRRPDGFCLCGLGLSPLIRRVHWAKVSLIGVGLLGGSLGLALRQRGLAKEVTGFVRRAASLAECEASGVVNRATLDLADATRCADLIVFCTPLGQMTGLARAMLPQLKRGAVVTDVGSVKAAVVRGLEPLFARVGAHFVGSHPMAGSEKMGVAAARADLFQDAVCVVTPTARTRPAALRRVESLWREVGCRVLRMDAGSHDRAVARASHLPHAVASALAHRVLDPRQPDAVARLCAGGFRDTTRIALSSPEMWRDIGLSNRRHLARELRGLKDTLAELADAIEAGDASALLKFHETARARRLAWAAANGKPAPA